MKGFDKLSRKGICQLSQVRRGQNLFFVELPEVQTHSHKLVVFSCNESSEGSLYRHCSAALREQRIPRHAQNFSPFARPDHE